MSRLRKLKAKVNNIKDFEFYAQTIKALHTSWKAHSGQVVIGRKLFTDDVRRIFIQCGRKWGKTEIILYILWRWAIFHPAASCYYISPYNKQSKEINWANKRVQTFGPREWLLKGSAGINNSEMRLNFTNGSFIKLDGSDNYAAYDGVNPHIMVYDEFKDFRPEFHHRMSPNLATHNAPIFIIGTPPERDCQYVEIAEEFKTDPYSFHYEAPTWENPAISTDWLGQEKARLFARGDQDKWFRDYGAKFIKGGKSSIFPMWNEKFIKPHGHIIAELKGDWSRLTWCVVCDPGTASVTAMIYFAYNPYTSKAYFLDEIYEEDQRKNTVNLIGKEFLDKKMQLNRRAEWVQVCDEAAAWFISEMLDRYDEYFMPTEKHLNKKDSGISLIKDCMLNGDFVVSDRCPKLVWEIEQYIKDKNGKIPKEDDHLIDSVRYGFAAVDYKLNEEKIKIPEVDRVAKETGRMITLESDLAEMRRDDMTFNTGYDY